MNTYRRNASIADWAEVSNRSVAFFTIFTTWDLHADVILLFLGDGCIPSSYLAENNYVLGDGKVDLTIIISHLFNSSRVPSKSISSEVSSRVSSGVSN